MGAQGTGKGFSGDVVLDAGALIAFERGNRKTRAMVTGACALGSRVLIPASVLAQTWRGGPRSASLAQLIDAGEIDLLDEVRAKEVGVRLGSRDRRDIADAHVACCAVERQAMVVTSDADDIGALVRPDEKVTVIPV